MNQSSDLLGFEPNIQSSSDDQINNENNNENSSDNDESEWLEKLSELRESTLLQRSNLSQEFEEYNSEDQDLQQLQKQENIQISILRYFLIPFSSIFLSPLFKF